MPLLGSQWSLLESPTTHLDVYFIFPLLTLDQHGLAMEYTDTDTRLPGFKSQRCLFQAVWRLLWFLHLLVSYPLSPGFVVNENSDTFWIQQWSHESLHCPLKKPEFKVLETTAKQPGRSVRTNRMQATQQQSVGVPGSRCPLGTFLSDDTLDIKSDLFLLCPILLEPYSLRKKNRLAKLVEAWNLRLRNT